MPKPDPAVLTPIEDQFDDGPERLRSAGFELPVGNDPASVRKRIEAMEMLLERSFVIPGINRPVGLDAIVGLVPVIGDFVGMALGAYIVWEARNLNMPKWKLLRMAGNVGIDWVIGLVPLVGDIFDVGFKANLRNAALMRDFAEKRHADTTSGQTPRQPPTRTPVQGLGRARGANA